MGEAQVKKSSPSADHNLATIPSNSLLQFHPRQARRDIHFDDRTSRVTPKRSVSFLFFLDAPAVMTSKRPAAEYMFKSKDGTLQTSDTKTENQVQMATAAQLAKRK
jgi:hypothetical protein